MRVVKSENLTAMVDFFYYGEANVFQENLDSFLVLAEELQLKGLRGNQTKEEASADAHKITKTLAYSVYYCCLFTSVKRIQYMR